MPPATTMSIAAGDEQVVRQHRRLHAGAAHLVDGGAAGASGRPAPSAAWRAGAWPWPAGSTQPMITSCTCSGFDASARSTAARMAAAPSSGRRQVLQLALKAAHGRAGGGNDDDGIVGHDVLHNWHNRNQTAYLDLTFIHLVIPGRRPKCNRQNGAARITHSSSPIPTTDGSLQTASTFRRPACDALFRWRFSQSYTPSFAKMEYAGIFPNLFGRQRE